LNNLDDVRRRNFIEGLISPTREHRSNINDITSVIGSPLGKKKIVLLKKKKNPLSPAPNRGDNT